VPCIFALLEWHSFRFSVFLSATKIAKKLSDFFTKIQKKTRIMFASSQHLVQHQRFSSASTSRKNNTSKRAASKSLSRANAVAVVGTFFFFFVLCFSARVLEFYPECDPSDVLRVSRNLFLFSLLCVQSSFSRARERVFSLTNADLVLLFSLCLDDAT
jgi:hypothetical protein